jgi:hypothetical protein
VTEANGTTPPQDDDPRERLRKRMSEPASVPIILGREGDVLLFRWAGRIERRGTQFGEKPAVIFYECDASGVFEASDVPEGTPAHTLLLGYVGRDLAKLNPQPGDWIGIRRGPKTKGALGTTYNKWDVYSAREDAGTIDLASLADEDEDDWTGATSGDFAERPSF